MQNLNGFLFACMVCIVFFTCTPTLNPAMHGAQAFMLGPATTNESLVGKNMTIEFTRVPNLLFIFKRLSGQPVPGTNMTYNWISIDEIDNSTGTAVEGDIPVVVKSLDIQDPNLVWTETVSYPVDSSNNIYKNINFTTTFPTGEKITFSYYYFAAPFTIDYDYINVTRTMSGDSFKLSISLTGWKPVSMANLFLLRLHDAAQPFFTKVVHSKSGVTYTVQIDVGDGQVTQLLNLLDVAVLEGKPQTLAWYAEYVGLTINPEIRIEGFKLYFYFQNFNDTFFYDPDLSVLVMDQGDETGGDGGSDSTTTIVVAVLVPTLVGGVLLIMATVVVVTLFFMKKKVFKLRDRLKKISSIGDAAEASAETPN